MEDIKALLFDLDGVIVNTAKYHYLAWKRLADEKGIYFDDIINERLKGVSRAASLDIILERADKEYSYDEKAVMMEIKNNWYVEMLDSLSQKDALPGVIELLSSAKSHGIKTAICSASKSANYIIDKMALGFYFDIIISGNDVKKSKPDPEVFTLAAERLGVKSGECVVFEDSFSGIQAANSVGMLSVGIGSKEILHNANVVYSGMNEFSLNDIRIVFEQIKGSVSL